MYLNLQCHLALSHKTETSQVSLAKRRKCNFYGADKKNKLKFLISVPWLAFLVARYGF